MDTDRRAVGVPYGRVASKRNQARRCASSIQFSRRFVVATSPASSQRSCAALIERTSAFVSSCSSLSISGAVTQSASLSAILFYPLMCPIERTVVPPVFRTLSAMSSVMAKSWPLPVRHSCRDLVNVLTDVRLSSSNPGLHDHPTIKNHSLIKVTGPRFDRRPSVALRLH